MSDLRKKYEGNGFLIFKNILSKRVLNKDYPKLITKYYSKALNKKVSINNLDNIIIESEKKKRI